MKVNELRLGNYVYAGHGDFPMYVTHIFPDEVYLNFNGNEGDPWEEKEKDLKPIPLTEDILLKSGFGKRSGGVGWDSYRFGALTLVMAPTAKGKTPAYQIDGDYILIRHIHQLQNLYFSLTGKELKVKL